MVGYGLSRHFTHNGLLLSLGVIGKKQKNTQKQQQNIRRFETNIGVLALPLFILTTLKQISHLFLTSPHL